MASVVKYQSSRYWVAAFYDASGKAHRRTTRETNKKRALAVAQQYERAAKSKGSAQRVRATFAEFYKEHYGEALPQASVRSFSPLSGWLPASRKRPPSRIGFTHSQSRSSSRFLGRKRRRRSTRPPAPKSQAFVTRSSP